MTVTNQTNRTSVVGDGTTQEIPFSFPASATSDIEVRSRVITTGVESDPLTENSDYTVSLSGDTGGTVTMITTFDSTYQIHVKRNTPMTQLLDLEQGGSFNAENIEDALDKNTKLSIENSNSLDRTLRFPETDADSIMEELPKASTRAGKFLYFGASDGNPSVAESITTGETTISTYGKTLIDDDSASAALTTLGFSPYGKTLIDDASALLARGTLGLDTTDNVEFAKITGTDIIPKSPWIDVRAYSAVADGTTDTTTPLQNAINAANSGVVKRVYFPAGVSYYKITSELTFYGGIEYFGDGVNSQIRQVTSNSNVLAASSQDDFSIHDLYLYGPGDASAGTNGNGIYLSNCDRVKIYDIKCENMGLWGIGLVDSDYNSIKNNFITNSGKDSVNSAGIYIGYSSSYNLVDGNIITNDKHGITIQSVIAGDYASYNTIIGNIIKTCDRHGIILYNTGYNGYVIGNRIIGNNIRDISDVLTSGLGNGIYCNGSEHTTIADNYVENTNQGTTLDDHVPGAIGVTHSHYSSILGNTIHDAQWYGIAVRQGAGVGSHATLIGNTVIDSVKNGIDIGNLPEVTVVGNIIDGGSANGIDAVSGADHEHLVIADNTISGVDAIGINIDGYNRVKVINNISADSVTSSGLLLASSDYSTIVNNEFSDNATIGLNIAITNTYTTIHKNTCVGNDKGIVVGAATTIVDFKDNIVTGSGTDDWTNGPYSTLATGEATPSVKGGRYFLTAGTTTITDFDDPYIGQVIYILAITSITITDGTNIFLNGSANFDMNDTDTLTLLCKADLKWYETGRSDNT